MVLRFNTSEEAPARLVLLCCSSRVSWGHGVYRTKGIVYSRLCSPSNCPAVIYPKGQGSTSIACRHLFPGSPLMMLEEAIRVSAPRSGEDEAVPWSWDTQARASTCLCARNGGAEPNWGGKRGCQAKGAGEPRSAVLGSATWGHRALIVPRILNSNQTFQVSMKGNLSKRMSHFMSWFVSLIYNC